MSTISADGATGQSVGRLVLSSPDAFLASIPHMVGFACQDSVVLVGLGPHPDDPSNRSGEVRLVQRFDMPPATATPAQLTVIAQTAVEPMVRSGSTEVIVAVFGPTPELGAELPSTPLVDALIASSDDAGLLPRDALFTDGVARWSYGCDNPDCCPPSGRVIPEQTRTLVAAEFAGAGAAMAPSRAAVADEIAAHRDRASAVTAVAADFAAPHGSQSTGGLEAWRDSALEHLNTLVRDDQPVTGPEDAAFALQGLADIRVRDTFLWDVSQPGSDPRMVSSRLADLVRCAPEGLVAPVATVLAITRWTSGDGARANVALDRASDDDPDYALANLVGSALRSGLPPSAWSASMATLDRDSCRHGSQPPVRPAAAAPPVPAPRAAAPSPGLAS